MTKKNYSEKLLDPRWQKKRLKIMERDNFSCRTCLDDKLTLHIHHLSYKENPWDVKDDQLITLCVDCHSLEEHLKSYNTTKDCLFGKVNKRVSSYGKVSFAVQIIYNEFPQRKEFIVFLKNKDNIFIQLEIVFTEEYIEFISETFKSL